MPAHDLLIRQPITQKIFWILIISLMMFLVVSSKSLADVLVNPQHALESDEMIEALDAAPGAPGTHFAVASGPMPPTAAADGGVRWPARRILKEVGKQAVDQPGHFLISAAPIWASRYLVGVPWFGWVAAPVLAYREWLQWPSNRWWDPPLDWGFLTLGALAATWRRRPGQRLAGALAALRQSAAPGLAVRGRMHQPG